MRPDMLVAFSNPELVLTEYHYTIVTSAVQ